MGAMSSCIGGINSHHAREMQFNLISPPSFSVQDRRKQFRLKQQTNSQIFKPIENDLEIDSNQYEISTDKNEGINNIKIMENIINTNINNNKNYTKPKLRGKINSYIKKKKLDSTEDYCDIIECDDEFECDKNASKNLNIKNTDLLSEKRVNYLPIQNVIINNIPSIKPSDMKQENGGNLMENVKSQLIIEDYNLQNSNKKYNSNLNHFKITKSNNISFPNKIEEKIENTNEFNNKKDISNNFNEIKNSNKENQDFQNCKIENNISFNINNSNIKNNNNLSMNSDIHNYNYIDISDRMTYLLSMDKSLRKPSSTRFEKKNILSIQKNNIIDINDNNISYNKDIGNNDYSLSERTNNYKYKLLPKHKNNSQIYKKSIIDLPSPRKNQSSLISEENQNNNNESSIIISEYQKQKERQDKVIKSLEKKIKNLEKKISEENITKINEKKIIRDNLMNNKMAESQKDFRIKKLEEQLNNVKKNNKLNKNLLKKKEEQIKNLLDRKIKQEKLIKQYEINISTKQKNMNHTTKANNYKINYLEDMSKSYNPKNENYLSPNNNLIESKMSYTKLNNSINIKPNKKEKRDSINNSVKKFHKKEKSINMQKHYFKSNSCNLEDYFSSEPENEHNRINSSMRESNKKNYNNRSSINITYSKYCNDLSKRDKNNYNNKITLNKMNIFKLNKSQKLTLNTDSKYNRFYIPLKKGKKLNKKEEIIHEFNFNMNSNNNPPILSTKNKKKFSFTKSKKLIRKKSEKDLREMYLQAGTAQNEETVSINPNINTNSDIKSFTPNDILLLTHKNSFNNSGIDTTITNKNNGINASLDDKLNISENINNLNIYNQYLKSTSNELIEKKESNKTNNDKVYQYQKLYKEGYLRYKQITLGKKVIEDKNMANNNYIYKLNFCMANDLIELKVDKRDMMFDVKNKFLKEFYKKKKYGEKEKKYIRDNILFLKKEGIINITKKVSENNLNNNDVIIPALKDMT